jgi:dTDP-L-rhamnose 4-epimerase
VTERVLITGGAGFIGTHTADALVAAGAEVRVLDNLDPQVHGDEARFPAALEEIAECRLGDVRDPDAVDRALSGVDRVLHGAALTGVGQSMYDLRSYTDVNVTGTANLLERVLRTRPDLRRLVLSSSRAVYGEGTFACGACGEVHPPPRDRADLDRGDFAIRCPGCGGPVHPVGSPEGRPLRPLSVYGWTKRCQEEQCTAAAETFGLPATVLRYFNVYGSGQSLVNPYTGIVSSFTTRLLDDRPIAIYEQGVPVRDFVHVSDVVRANVAALGTDLAPGTVVNVGTGVGVTITEVAEQLAHALGRPADIEVGSQFRVGDIHSCIATTDRLAATLGIEAQVTLAAGLAEFAGWAADREYVDLSDRAAKELEAFGLFAQGDGPGRGRGQGPAGAG